LSFDTFNDYASYEKLPNLSINILEKLLENEDLWKLIANDNPDALSPSNPSLTPKEKRDLIYKGEEDSSPFRIFTQPSTDDAFSVQTTQLRIYPSVTDPYRRVLAYSDIVFEIITHAKINTLQDGTSRIDHIHYEVLKTLNGKDIKGVGNLFFDSGSRSTNRAILKINNNKNYFGFMLVMSTNIG